MSDSELSRKTKSKEKASEKQINWKECLCHSYGQTGDISSFSEQTFRKTAEIRNDIVHNRLKHYWSARPRSGYHRRCYQAYTCKRNLKYTLKRKIDDNVKVPVTSKPAKLPRIYDRSKCIISLEEKLLADRKSREQLYQCLTEDCVSSLTRATTNDLFLVKRLGSGYDILYHKTCYKKLTRRLYQINENMENTSVNEESAIFDRSFNTLASEIEQNVLESLKVATMSELKTRFCQLLSNEGIVTSNYKSLYLQKRLEKRFGSKLSFWRPK